MRGPRSLVISWSVSGAAAAQEERKKNQKLEQNKRFYRNAAASCQQEASGEDAHSVDGKLQYTVTRDINPRPVGRTCTPAQNTEWFRRERWYEVGQGTSSREELNQRQPGAQGRTQTA